MDEKQTKEYCISGDSKELPLGTQQNTTSNIPAASSRTPDPSRHVETIIVREYLPPGVSRIIACGAGCFIGYIDESTVLKYPCVPNHKFLKTEESLEVEAQILDTLGKHPRIIGSKGLNEHGLLLHYLPNGSLYDHVNAHADIPLDQKLRWCRQAAEAVQYIHSKNVLHCDISLRNFLLDDDFNILLADFEGVLKSPDGYTLLDGLARNGVKAYPPSADCGCVNVKTDIFALGSAIYFIMMGHDVFPELNDVHDEEEIESRFRDGLFPTDTHLYCEISERCWKGYYTSAKEVLSDIAKL
ncbi:kinase-like protein [Aspergillus avenaceus]|uniref:EKC/KEOPS complex subunit BUD32 n=1 Tax=Aspergillus avenaceus TaxID=36643 RepID=A0A5N6U181_ASPAV|nr:kinase-like protein [Aspergillus avenaceus]